MRVLILFMATILSNLTYAKCNDTDVIGVVADVEIGTTGPVMITPISEISTYNLTQGFMILANSEIVTDATSRVHVVFVDGTSLNVGPNNRIKIDENLFACNSQNLTTQAAKGFLRVITSKLSKKASPAPLQGFSSAIGIRG